MSWLPDLIDEIAFRKLLLEELRTLNSSLARIAYTIDQVFPPPPEASYTLNPEETSIEFADETTLEKDPEEGPARLKKGNVEVEGSDAF